MNLEEQYDKLLRYCTMKTGSRTLAEDLVQETFLRFWQHHSYEETGGAMAYLYTVARNLCTDQLRRPAVHDLDALSESLPAPPENEDALAIEMALERLPEDLREIVFLRYTNDLSAAQIGKLLGLSRFAVHRRLNQALRLLKTALCEVEA